MSTYTVDGLALDHPLGLWYLEKGTGRRAIPARRGINVALAGRAGELPMPREDLEPTVLPFTFNVRGRRPDGRPGTEADLERNMEALIALLMPPHRLVDLRHHIGEGMIRQADAKFNAGSEPELLAGANAIRLTMAARIPGVFWRDVAAATWSGGRLDGWSYVATPLSGCSGEITDALIRVTGPAGDDIVVNDLASGGSVVADVDLSGGERLLIDCGRMRAAVVDTDTWDLADGQDVTGLIDSTGPGSAYRWLHLTPSIYGHDAHSRLIQVGGTAPGTSGATRLAIRARRAYL
ncbi:hypothetical protein [Herbidospora mongoliensis]|uniref:hypothetical protein n=1 Tax=Herbidospora mongoliensis TaxID=688067 RepID=UPI00082D5126|nr:hypothetical protein [Herbidospora mongoliensis]